MKYKKFIKPWGYELLLEKNKNYMLKKLFMKKGHRCSLLFHNKKFETLYILSGKLKFYIGSTSKKLKSSIYLSTQTLTLKPKIIHRMEALSDCTYLEASTPEFLDVVRISDDYSRV